MDKQKIGNQDRAVQSRLPTAESCEQAYGRKRKQASVSAAAERLDKMDRHIAKCKSFIALQHALVDRLKRSGQDIQQAERLLGKLMEIHDLYVSYRQVHRDRLARRATYVRQSHAIRKLARRRPKRTRKSRRMGAPKRAQPAEGLWRGNDIGLQKRQRD